MVDIFVWKKGVKQCLDNGFGDDESSKLARCTLTLSSSGNLTADEV